MGFPRQFLSEAVGSKESMLVRSSTCLADFFGFKIMLQEEK